jgi:hypothetical protein
MNSMYNDPYQEYFNRLTNQTPNNNITDIGQYLTNDNLVNYHVPSGNEIFNNYINHTTILNEDHISNIVTRLVFDDIEVNEIDDIDEIDNNVDLQGQNLILLISIELNELEQIIEAETFCSICLEQYTSGLDENANVCRIGCGHHYHFNCIGNWLNTHSTCPLCRTQL